MLGLLGGLMGGLGRRAIGGGFGGRFGGGLGQRRPMLANMLDGLGNRRQQGGQSSYGQGDRREQNVTPQEEPAEQATVAQQPGDEIPQPVADQPQQSFVRQASQPIQQQAVQQQEIASQPMRPGEPATREQPQSVTSALLDQPATPESQTAIDTTEPLPEVPQTVNVTSSDTPVARPDSEVFPADPEMEDPGLVSKILDPIPRRDFPVEDGNPTQPIRLNQARHTANSPGFHYQTRGTSTALMPRYSYRRR